MNSFDKYRRTIAKTLTYKVLVTAINYGVILFLSGSQEIAVAFTGLYLVYTTAIYFAHERSWSYINWGKL